MKLYFTIIILLGYLGLTYGYSDGPQTLGDQYLYIGEFDDGWAVARTKECRWGVIDDKGMVLLDPQFDFVQRPAPNLICGWEAKTPHYYLRQDSTWIPLPYSKVEPLNERLFAVEVDGVWGIVNAYGEGIALMYYQAVKAINDDFVAVRSDGKWGIINLEGKTIVSPMYDAVEISDHASDFIGIKEGLKWGVIKTDGSTALLAQYQEVRFVSPTIVGLQTANNTWILKNTANEFITKSTFENIEMLDGKVIAAAKNKKWGILKDNGKFLLEPNYSKVDAIPNTHQFLVKSSKGFGIINQAGKWLLPLEQKQIITGTHSRASLLKKEWTLEGEFKPKEPINGLLLLDKATDLWAIQQGEVWGIWEGAESDWLLPPAYTNVQIYAYGAFRVQLEEEWLWLDRKGNEISCAALR